MQDLPIPIENPRQRLHREVTTARAHLTAVLAEIVAENGPELPEANIGYGTADHLARGLEHFQDVIRMTASAATPDPARPMAWFVEKTVRGARSGSRVLYGEEAAARRFAAKQNMSELDRDVSYVVVSVAAN